jgi:tetratricopeptide (TPR) repeat protein
LSDSGERQGGVDALAGQGVQIGDHNAQFNFFADANRRGATGAGPVVVGDVPQEPASFQPRADLMAALEQKTRGRVSVVFAVTGIRGVGKTQVAAAYARRRITEGWRLVAWVDATDTVSALAGLARVATVVGLSAAGEDAAMLAEGVRRWLESDGERRLLVFDNAADLDGLRPFIPAGGAAQIVITSNRRSAADLGTGVAVDVFTEDEALGFLAKRTGLDDTDGARELAVELGFLPLGLAQAAALIAREHLRYGTYLGRLRALPVAEYLGRVEGDAYPYRTAEAIVLSLRSVEEGDPSGRCAAVMGLVSVLAETGVSRRLLHLAVSGGASGDADAVAMDATVGVLADASLVGFSGDDAVIAHRLVMRVMRERLAADGQLPAVVVWAVQVLARLGNGITEAWRDPAGVRELAVHMKGHLNADSATALLQLRLQSVYLLNELGDSAGLAILAAEPLAVDCERILGADHADTLISRNNLAVAYRAAGRTADAIPLLERILAVSERVLGADHADTLISRNNLAMVYQDAGRIADAIPLYEHTLADRERLLGGGDLHTLMSRNNLAAVYQDAGRIADAIPLYEQTLADRERLLGADHPDILMSRNNLALVYQDAGRIADAIRLYEETLVDCERLLGVSHPNTLTSRNNLAAAYRAAGRIADAIPLLERTLADRERLLGADHRNTLMSRNNLAAVYQAAGRIADAVPLYEQTLADSERLLGVSHPNTLTSRNNLAAANWAAGRIADAIPLLERTLADRERLLGADHPDTLMSRNNLATAYQDAGRAADAIALYEQTPRR